MKILLSGIRKAIVFKMRVLILLSVILALCIGQYSSLPTLHRLNENEIQHISSENDLLFRMGEPDTKPSLSGMFFINHFLDILKIKEFILSIRNRAMSFTECLSCKFTVAFLHHYISIGATEKDVGALVYRICTFFRIETPRVCSGVTKMFEDVLTRVIANVALEPAEVCSFLFEGCGKPINPLHQWAVPLTPFPKPPVKPPLPPQPGSPIYRVLHISDVHIDPYYYEGSNANCGEPLCCRETSGKPARPEDAAGYWGDYRNCDTPLRTLEDMLDHINKTHKIDYVLWTGDIPPHDIWNNSRGEAVSLLHEASQVIHKHLGAVPIFPAIGNHESSPANSFPLPQMKGNDSIAWLYKEVVKAWGNWVPGNNATLNLGAYYTAYVDKGLRIISLNMNYCNAMNWWLLMNTTDPTGQLAWLVAQLQMAEIKGEKVHIIGHISSGQPDCLGVWSSNYYKIINRYESTVTAQFFGHTHTDEFEVFYDNKTNLHPRATSISYIGPSVTTYLGVNPGYRIYTVDGNYPGSSRVVLDHETYFTNLTEANMYKKLKWRLEYSAKEAYNMTSLLPSEWHRLTERFEEDDALFQKFYRYYNKMTDYYEGPCDATCKKIYICRMRRGQSNDPLVC